VPKYVPKPDDMYDTRPCFICGGDVLDEGADTCSDFCKMQKDIFDEDWEWFQWKHYEGEEDDWA